MKKKILVLTPRFPYPVIGGDRLRIHQMCKVLSKDFDLTLLSLCENKYEMSYNIPKDGIFKKIHRVHLGVYKSYFNVFLGFFSSKPLQVHYYKSKKYQEQVKALAINHDVIFCHLIRTAEFARKIKRKKILEMTDAISLNYLRFKERKTNLLSLKKYIYQIDEKRLNKYEKDIVNDFDLNILVSEIDKNHLFQNNSIGHKKTMVLSNGVDFNYFKYHNVTDNKTIIFIGNLYSLQNLDAVYWFASMVLPILIEKGPYIFKVIGKIKERDARKLEKISGVIVKRNVISVVDESKGALAAVCPVWLGAGVQNKLLEYFSMGVPAITTTIGLEGLNAIPEKDVLVAKTPEMFVEKIEFLKNSPEKRKMISLNARRYIEQNHSWSKTLFGLTKKINKFF